MLYKILESFKNKKNDDSTNMDMGQVLANYIARDSVQTYDYGIRFKGLGKSLTTMTTKLSFQEVMSEMGKHLSLNGDMTALILELVDNKPFIDWGLVSDYTKVGDDLIDVTIDTMRTIEMDGQAYPLYKRYTINQAGNVIKDEGYVNNKKEWVSNLKVVVTTPFTKIPVQTFKNNALGEADIPEELVPMIAQLDWLGDDLIPEYIASSTQWINNKAFGSTAAAEDYMDASKEHKKVHDADDPDNKIGPSIAPISNGTQSINNLLLSVNFVEDKILKYTRQFREVGQGGNNKHNLEISSQNKQAFEYMLEKLDYRQKQLAAAFTHFQSLMAQVADENPAPITVTIDVPELEQYKVDNMKAQVDNMKAQTKNQLGQAKSWEASAKATEKGETPNEVQ